MPGKKLAFRWLLGGEATFEVSFGKLEALNHRAHAPVEEHDPLLQRIEDFLVLRHYVSSESSCSSQYRQNTLVRMTGDRTGRCSTLTPGRGLDVVARGTQQNEGQT
jgi:hypothetical protein